MFLLLSRDSDEGIHHWCALECSNINQTDTDDILLDNIVRIVREAYGEDGIIEVARRVPPVSESDDELVGRDWNTTAIRNAIRKGFPDPTISVEANKPVGWRNYRSEAAEMVARAALAQVHSISFPVAPQVGKPNPNMPVLGFDGWGILTNGAEYMFVLLQVKGTDDDQRPPQAADELIRECGKAPRDEAIICRALTVIACALDENAPMFSVVLGFLEAIGDGKDIDIVVAPVIVRGLITAHLDDLSSIRDQRETYRPATARGLTVSISRDLTEFGYQVMTKARSAA